MPSHTPEELNRALLQLVTQSGNIQPAELNTGLLAPNQQSPLDILRNPADNWQLTFTDVSGKLYYFIEGSGKSQIDLNTRDYNKGIYLVQLRSKKGILQSRKILIN